MKCLSIRPENNSAHINLVSICDPTLPNVRFGSKPAIGLTEDQCPLWRKADIQRIKSPDLSLADKVELGRMMANKCQQEHHGHGI